MFHSSKPEFRFSTGSNPARSVLEIRDGENRWQWSRLEIWLRLLSVNHTTKKKKKKKQTKQQNNKQLNKQQNTQDLVQ